MADATVVTADHVERTITAFTKLDQRGDKKAMNKLAHFVRVNLKQPDELVSRIPAQKI